ncbi:MAG TPA: DNA polymerase ligase N-terminal domain-containing protein [Gemmataceae bacterium]|nr:DNA polymerase ligase N-terminal domain-containing protein [Gemmataceae bacterium]
MRTRPGSQERPRHSMYGQFVIQKHRARTLHYDFRLEKDGVLKSWAVPKGVPEEEGVKHLAIQVGDHPLEYADFEGTIPKGEYGAGTVETWDRGTYDLHEWTNDVIVFTLHGQRLEGTYNLIRFRRSGANAWLLLKHRPRDLHA